MPNRYCIPLEQIHILRVSSVQLWQCHLCQIGSSHVHPILEFRHVVEGELYSILRIPTLPPTNLVTRTGQSLQHICIYRYQHKVLIIPSISGIFAKTLILSSLGIITLIQINNLFKPYEQSNLYSIWTLSGPTAGIRWWWWKWKWLISTSICINSNGFTRSDCTGRTGCTCCVCCVFLTAYRTNIIPRYQHSYFLDN